MIKRILSILVVVALLTAPLAAAPRTAKAVSGFSVSISPSTSNTLTQITASFTLQNTVPIGQWVRLTLPSFQVPNSVIASPTVAIAPAVAGLTATLNSAGVVYLYSSTAAFPATSYTLTLTTAAGIKTPVSAGTFTPTLDTSVYAEPVANCSVLVGGTGVNNVYVYPSSVVAGGASSYTVSFYTSPLGVLNGPTDTITVTFPAGTTIPASYTAGTISVNATEPTAVTKLNATQVQVTMPTLGSPASSIVLVFQQSYGLLNTTTAGTYSLTVATSKDLAAVASNTFTIAGTSISNLSVNVTPLTPSTAAQFTISFLTSAPATGIKTGDKIYVEFPAGTTFPSGSFCPACFVINGQAAQLAPTRSNNIVMITVPTTIVSAQQFVTLQIGTTANIQNPATPGSYTLKVSTSLDSNPVQSSSYTITGTSISNLALTATPTAQSAYPELRFTFTTSSTGALTNADYIYVDLPTAMDVPATVPASAVTVNGAQATSVTKDGADKLVIRMPLSVGNNQQVTLVIAATSGIRNPATVGTTLNFDVWTNEDVGRRTVSFVTTTSQISQPQVTLTTNGVGKASGYTVTFQTGAGGTLAAGTGRITIVFPVGTAVPSSIAAQYVKVNGSAVSSVTTSVGNRRVEVITPITIAGTSTVSVVIDAAANIVNPSTPATSYTLVVYTSAEQTQVNSISYAIVNLPTSTAVTYPANPDGLNGYYKTRPQVTITASSPSGLPVSIYYRINGGAETMYGGPVQIPDGLAVVLSYYAKDTQNNQEQPKQLMFKVDATAPAVTVTAPAEGTVTGTAAVTVTGRTEAGSTVTINGNPAVVQPTGDFGGTVTITEGANAVQVIATDQAGNVGQARVNVTLDTKPPVLTVISPKIYATIMTQQVEVSGKTEAGATLTVAGSRVPVASDGSFSIMYMFPKEGLNVIDVVATDAAGNTAKAGIPVTYVARTLIRLQVGNRTAMINDATKTLQVAPINTKGVVTVPLRFIGEAFGATVEWEPVFRVVRIQLDTTVIYLQIGSNYASVNGKKVALQGPASIVSGTTMVPIRFISEAFNAQVVWNAPTQGIDITYPKP